MLRKMHKRLLHHGTSSAEKLKPMMFRLISYTAESAIPICIRSAMNGEALYFPMVPGHEIIGRVSKIGNKVKKFKVGDLAGVGCMVDSCGECDNCHHGLEQYCTGGISFTYNSLEQDKKTRTYGGYSKLIVVKEDFVLHVSEKLPIKAVAPLIMCRNHNLFTTETLENREGT